MLWLSWKHRSFRFPSLLFFFFFSSSSAENKRLELFKLLQLYKQQPVRKKLPCPRAQEHQQYLPTKTALCISVPLVRSHYCSTAMLGNKQKKDFRLLNDFSHFPNANSRYLNCALNQRMLQPLKWKNLWTKAVLGWRQRLGAEMAGRTLWPDLKTSKHCAKIPQPLVPLQDSGSRNLSKLCYPVQDILGGGPALKSKVLQLQKMYIHL